jgi:RNA polymerase sigma-70 factor (ECF subfamily)
MSGSHAVAKAFQGRAQQACPVLIDGKLGVLVAPHGRLLLVLDVTLREGRIAAIDAIADPDRLAGFAFAVLPEA